LLITGWDDLGVLEQEIDELCYSIRFHPRLLHDQVVVVFDFVVPDKWGH